MADDRSVNTFERGRLPGKEVSPPTVAETQNFMAWKDEAPSLWKLTKVLDERKVTAMSLFCSAGCHTMNVTGAYKRYSNAVAPVPVRTQR